MTSEEIRCEHQCRNSWAMLNDSLRQETDVVRFYERVLTQCEDPEIRDFLRTLVENHSEAVIRILQKLNEIKARSQTMDGIASSYH